MLIMMIMIREIPIRRETVLSIVIKAMAAIFIVIIIACKRYQVGS